MDDIDVERSSPKVRDTQRVPRSCIQCSKRKIKCSKTVPCLACVRRGDPLSCSREVVRVNGKITIAVDPESPESGLEPSSGLAKENSALRDRVRELEILLAQGVGNRPGFPAFTPQTSILQSGEDIHDTFDTLHLGSQSDATSLRTPLGFDSLHKFPDLISLLPIRTSSERLIRFSLGILGWIHCAVDAPKFIEEHDAFWSGLESHNREATSNHSWIAVYMSVLAVGAYFMDDDLACELHYLHEGFTGQQKPGHIAATGGMMQISRSWYDAAFQELGLSDFLSKPNICTVQTLAICALVHRNFGEPDRDYILLGTAINLARTLGMDRLGSEETIPAGLERRPEWKERSKRELGRRLWWTLVICDWMTIFSRPASISSHSFNSVLSIEQDNSQNCIVTTLQPFAKHEGLYSLSPLHYHLIVSKVAYTIYSHIKGTNKRSISSTCKALQELNGITHSLPDHLMQTQKDTFRKSQDLTWPWIPVQRNQLALVIEACRVNICLSYLPKYLETGEDKFDIHERGLDAASKIIHLRQQDPSKLFPKLWGVPTATLAAGIYLAIDLICFKGSKTKNKWDSQYRLIEQCISVLESVDNLASAAYCGPMILKRLLQLETVWVVEQPVGRHTISRIMKTVGTFPKTSDQELYGGTPSSSQPAWDLDLAVEHQLHSGTTSANTVYSSFNNMDFFNPIAAGFGIDFESMDYQGAENMQNFSFDWQDAPLDPH